MRLKLLKHGQLAELPAGQIGKMLLPVPARLGPTVHQLRTQNRLRPAARTPAQPPRLAGLAVLGPFQDRQLAEHLAGQVPHGGPALAGHGCHHVPAGSPGARVAQQYVRALLGNLGPQPARPGPVSQVQLLTFQGHRFTF